MWGQWKFYWTNGSLKHKFEYKIICDSCYLNQGMSFDKNGALNRQKSNFYTVKYQDKARINEKIKFLFKYNKMNKNSIVELFISSEIDKNFCDLDNKNYIISPFKEDSIIANIGYSSKGHKNIRGFIKEYLPQNDWKIPYRIVYVDIPLEIY